MHLKLIINFLKGGRIKNDRGMILMVSFSILFLFNRKFASLDFKLWELCGNCRVFTVKPFVLVSWVC